MEPGKVLYIRRDYKIEGMEAADIEDAGRIADGDPLISKGLYRYEIIEREMVILSKGFKEINGI